MSGRGASRLAWSLAGLSFAVFAASFMLYVLILSVRVPGSVGESRTILDFLIFMPFLAFPVVGALVVSKHPRNPVGWICVAVGLLWALLDLFDYYSVYGIDRPGSVPIPVAVAGLGQWLWVPAVGLLGIYLTLLFPDGRLLSRRWRPLAWISGAVIVSLSVTQGLVPGPIADLGGVRNPFGLDGQPWISDAANVILALFLLCILASTLSLILRYRRSRGEERQQIKWIAFAASFLGLTFVSTMGIGLIVYAFSPETYGGGPPYWLELLLSVALLSFGGVPIAVGFAILRYRLYDIDVIVNRTLVYGLLTVMLVLVYFGCVVSLQYFFRTLTGQTSQLVIVASTLIIAALFNPLRKRIQVLVDRRFYRKKYDARRVLEAYSSRLKDETTLDNLDTEIISVVSETLRPAHVSLWLREPTGDTSGRTRA